ncbi:MAG: hypothetical protein ACYDHX_17595 [Methanothrix sp.]
MFRSRSARCWDDPSGKIFQPGLELEGLGLCQGRLPPLQPLCLPESRGCTGSLLQGFGISG